MKKIVMFFLMVSVLLSFSLCSAANSKWVGLAGRMYVGVEVYDGFPERNEMELIGKITRIDTDNGRIQIYRPASGTYQWFNRRDLVEYGLYIREDDPAYCKAMGR